MVAKHNVMRIDSIRSQMVLGVFELALACCVGDPL